MPRQPRLIKDVLDEIKYNIVKHSVKVANPYYIGHMTSAVPYFMILLDMIAVSLNQNQVKIESAKASSFVEREFLCWITSSSMTTRLIFIKKIYRTRKLRWAYYIRRDHRQSNGPDPCHGQGVFRLTKGFQRDPD